MKPGEICGKQCVIANVRTVIHCVNTGILLLASWSFRFELTIQYQIKKAKVIDPAQLPHLVLGGTRYLVPGTLVLGGPVPW